MEEIKNINLPIVGRIQHGEKQVLNQKSKVVELGYFIAKIKNDNMNFLLNRFNEKYKEQDKITVHFFDENPLTVKRVRYNQSGAVCYCMQNEEQGKQKVSNVWQPIKCSEDCKYRVANDSSHKPMCNVEGTLKFLLPEISKDRIWLMKITGQTSIRRLNSYFNLQRQLGNSIIGDYIIFLNKEQQTNREGKSFSNYILDIMKKEDFISNDLISKNQDNSNLLSTNIEQNVNKTVSNSGECEFTTKEKSKKEISKKSSQKNNKEIEKEVVKQKETTMVDDIQIDDNINNYYVLVDTFSKSLMKEGKLTDYLFATFMDINDKTVDVAIPPSLSEDLLKCDIGTTVKLSLSSKNDNTFTNSIEYVQKILKNVAA